MPCEVNEVSAGGPTDLLAPQLAVGSLRTRGTLWRGRPGGVSLPPPLLRSNCVALNEFHLVILFHDVQMSEGMCTIVYNSVLPFSGILQVKYHLPLFGYVNYQCLQFSFAGCRHNRYQQCGNSFLCVQSWLLLLRINLRRTVFFAESMMVLKDTPRCREYSSGGPVTALPSRIFTAVISTHVP